MTPIGDDHTIRTGMDVLAHALSWLRMRFASVRVEVVYIPAALSIYRHAGDTVTYCIGTDVIRTAPTGKVERNHAFIRDLARDITGRQGIPFLDTTPALRAAASANVIHGPRDGAISTKSAIAFSVRWLPHRCGPSIDQLRRP